MLRNLPVYGLEWLGQLQLPSLKSLVLDGAAMDRLGKHRPRNTHSYVESPIVADAVVPFILGSGYKLEDLTLANLPAIAAEDLTNMVSHLPPLRRLSLFNMVDTSLSFDGDMDSFFEDVQEVRELGGNLLPLLEYFHFEAPRIKAIADANARDDVGKKRWNIFKSDPVTWWNASSSALV